MTTLIAINMFILFMLSIVFAVSAYAIYDTCYKEQFAYTRSDKILFVSISIILIAVTSVLTYYTIDFNLVKLGISGLFISVSATPAMTNNRHIFNKEYIIEGSHHLITVRKNGAVIVAGVYVGSISKHPKQHDKKGFEYHLNIVEDPALKWCQKLWIKQTKQGILNRLKMFKNPRCVEGMEKTLNTTYDGMSITIFEDGSFEKHEDPATQ